MSDLYNTWKGKEKKVSKTFSPMIGMVYEGVEKFFGKNVIGVLVELHENNDEAVVRTRENKLVSVQIKSLKARVDE